MEVKEYLEEEFSKEESKKNTTLSLYGSLEGHLDLKDFLELRYLSFHGKDITGLDLSNNKKLEQVRVFNNKKLSGDLKIFSHLIELKELSVARCPFIGNLESLKNCTKLEKLHVQGTKINGGLEYLPLNNLKEFWCDGELEDAIRPFGYDILAWKLVNHPDLVATDKEKLIEKLDETIKKSQQKLDEIGETKCSFLCSSNKHHSDCSKNLKELLKYKIEKLTEFKVSELPPPKRE